jgi:hypothetical protein
MLSSLLCRNDNRGADEETRADVDLRLVPFDVDASYAVCGGLPHGRFVKRY